MVPRDIFPRIPRTVQLRSDSWRSCVTATVHLSVHCCNVMLSTVRPTAQCCAGCSHLWHNTILLYCSLFQPKRYTCKLATVNMFRSMISDLERCSSVVECRTRNQVSPGSNPRLLPFRSLGIFVLSTDAPVDSDV